MIEPSFGASLLAIVSPAALTAAGSEVAGLAVVPLSAVAVPADPEHRATCCEEPPHHDDHVRPEAGLDNGD